MIQTISQSDFTTAFHRMDRGSQFSYHALVMLFDYLEQYEEDTGEQVELDVISLCCDYAESHICDIIGDYDTEITEHLDEDASEDDQIIYLREWLSNNTTLIGEPSEGVFLFQQF
jgi:hypothetical protein